MGEVIDFKPNSAEEVVKDAADKGLTDVVIVGFDADGTLFVSTNLGDSATVLGFMRLGARITEDMALGLDRYVDG